MGRYEIRRRGLDICETYLDLMRLSFDARAVEQKAVALPWLFASHPSGHPTGSFFLTLEHKGTVVGGTIIAADTIWLDGAERPAFLPIGNHVHPDHRGRGLQLMKAMYSLADVGVSMGLPNDRSFGVHRRFDASLSELRTTRFRTYLAGGILAQRKPALSVLSPIFDGISTLCNELINCARPRPTKGESVEQLVTFGPDLDAFWLEARQHHQFLCVRSAERMQWRYRDAPFSRYEVDVLRRDGAIKGIIVTRVTDRNGHLIGEVSDILCIEDKPRDYALLLSVAGQRFGDANVEFAEFAFISPNALNAAGRRTGFWFPRDKRRIVACGLGPRDSHAVPRLIDNIHFLRGDHDEDY
jgi:hypothetical protein